MNSTFYDCDALTSIDVNSFNVNKVNNASAMFGSCENLVTIYCDKTWNISTTQNMFGRSTKLKSHNLSYNSNKTDGDMANPYTGYFTPSNLQIELANDADNSSATTKYAGMQVAKVTLTGRTFYHDGKWNTLCLPFNVASFTGTPLAGATVREIDVEGTYNGKKTGFDAETGTLYLYFKEAVTSIVAHKPYIVMWDDGDANTIDNPEFTSVTIVSGSASSVNSEDGKVSFAGTYSYQKFNSEDNSILLLGGDNSLYYPKANASIGAQRAFFQLHDITAGTPTSSVRSFVMNIDDSDATGLKEVTTPLASGEGNGNEAWYSLDGRKLSGKPAQKGVYIHEGRKVVMP